MLNQTFADFAPIRIDRRQPVANQISTISGRRSSRSPSRPGPLSRGRRWPRASRSARRRSATPSSVSSTRPLVTVHPQSSTMVAPIDVDQAHEAQFLRISLECEVSRTIALDPARLRPRDPRAAPRGHAPGLGRRPGQAGLRREDLGYHRAMFRTTGHEGLWELVKQRSGNVDRLRNLHLPEPGKARQDPRRPPRPPRRPEGRRRRCEAQRVIRRHLTGTLGKAHELREAHRAVLLLGAVRRDGAAPPAAPAFSTSAASIASSSPVRSVSGLRTGPAAKPRRRTPALIAETA